MPVLVRGGSLRSILVVGACLIGASCAASCGGARSASSGTTPPGSAAIPVAVLAANGIAVSPAQQGTPVSTPQTVAEQTALQRFSAGSAVLTSALMTVSEASRSLRCTCWVVSINPAGDFGGAGPATHGGTPNAPVPVNYAVVAVDATSGAVILVDDGRDASLPDLPTLTVPPSPGS